MNTKRKNKKNDIEDQGSKFLLAEYEMLQRLRQGVVSADEARLNFFIAIASGAIFSFTFLDQILERNVAIIVAGTIAFNIFFLGVLTFARSVERSIRVIVYTRGMNRIRRYFTQISPNVQEYLVLSTNDDHPPYGAVGNLTKSLWLEPATIIAIINSAVASIGIAMLGGVVLKLLMTTNFIICISSFLIMFFAHHRYHIARYSNEGRKLEIRFPSNNKE